MPTPKQLNLVAVGLDKLGVLKDKVIGRISEAKEQIEIEASLDRTRAELAEKGLETRAKKDKDRTLERRRSRWEEDEPFYV